MDDAHVMRGVNGDRHPIAHGRHDACLGGGALREVHGMLRAKCHALARHEREAPVEAHHAAQHEICGGTVSQARGHTLPRALERSKLLAARPHVTKTGHVRELIHGGQPRQDLVARRARGAAPVGATPRLLD